MVWLGGEAQEPYIHVTVGDRVPFNKQYIEFIHVESQRRDSATATSDAHMGS
jgi:hypothetical protein